VFMVVAMAAPVVWRAGAPRPAEVVPLLRSSPRSAPSVVMMTRWAAGRGRRPAK